MSVIDIVFITMCVTIIVIIFVGPNETVIDDIFVRLLV